MRISFFALPALFLPGLCGQVSPSAIPKGPNPPVVFLNGYQADCKSSTFAGTFGSFASVLLAQNRQSLFFDNCAYTTIASKPSIEELGNSLAAFLGSLRYTDGTQVSQVDVVAHSMGGLIVRSYLAGKQLDGSYTPPLVVPIRKFILLAVPNFGTPVTLGVAFDQQLVELAEGSTFTYELATWNQGTDDLRNVDAFAIAGNGGTGAATMPRFDDGVVPLTSASIGFARANRTRILPVCHTGPGLVTLAALCPAGEKGIAEVTGPGDVTAIMVTSFLADGPEYNVYGQPAAENEFLFEGGGLTLRAKSAMDQFVPITAGDSSGNKLNIRNTQVAYRNFIFPRNQSITLTAGGSTVVQPFVVTPGYTSATLVKAGPSINRVLPSAANVSPLAVGSNSYISIYGSGLTGAQVTASGTPLNVLATSATQINAVLTADQTKSVIPIVISSAAGIASISVYVKPNVPALFTQNSSGAGPASALNAVTNTLVTSSAPLKAGDYVSLYLTGLTFSPFFTTDVSVTVGGKNCPVQFAGIAPGYTVLDQINCQIPAGLSSTTAATIVTVSGVASNTVTLAVQ